MFCKTHFGKTIARCRCWMPLHPCRRRASASTLKAALICWRRSIARRTGSSEIRSLSCVRRRCTGLAAILKLGINLKQPTAFCLPSIKPSSRKTLHDKTGLSPICALNRTDRRPPATIRTRSLFLALPDQASRRSSFFSVPSTASRRAMKLRLSTPRCAAAFRRALSRHAEIWTIFPTTFMLHFAIVILTRSRGVLDRRAC